MTSRSFNVLVALALLFGSVSSVGHMASHLVGDGRLQAIGVQSVSAGHHSHFLHGESGHRGKLADHDDTDLSEAESCLIYHAYLGMSGAFCDAKLLIAIALPTLPTSTQVRRATLQERQQTHNIRGPPDIS